MLDAEPARVSQAVASALAHQFGDDGAPLPDDIKGELKAAPADTKTPYGPKPQDRPSKTQGFLIQGNVGGAQAVHTASDIPLSAYGPGWAQFVGVQNNTDVFFTLLAAAQGGC